MCPGPRFWYIIFQISHELIPAAYEMKKPRSLSSFDSLFNIYREDTTRKSKELISFSSENAYLKRTPELCVFLPHWRSLVMLRPSVTAVLHVESEADEMIDGVARLLVVSNNTFAVRGMNGWDAGHFYAHTG